MFIMVVYVFYNIKLSHTVCGEEYDVLLRIVCLSIATLLHIVKCLNCVYGRESHFRNYWDADGDSANANMHYKRLCYGIVAIAQWKILMVWGNFSPNGGWVVDNYNYFTFQNLCNVALAEAFGFENVFCVKLF